MLSPLSLLAALGVTPAQAAGVPTASVKSATGVSLHGGTLHASVNPQGSETTYQFEYTTAKDFAKNGWANAIDVPASPKGIGSGTEGVEVQETVAGLEPRTRYRFRVAATSAEGTTYGVTPSYNSAFGSEGTGNGQFNVMTDVAVDPTDGTIWVADDGNERIQHFSSGGQYLGQFESCYDPGSVIVDSAGDLYVACSSAYKIQ